MRIFIAINLPGEIKKELKEITQELNYSFPEKGIVRWVGKDNLHLTLLFLGNIREEALLETSEIVKKTVQKENPFSLKLTNIQYGPPGKMPPRLIWLNIEKKPELVEVVENLKKEIAEKGILNKFEEKAFSPHITLGRIRAFQWRRMEPEERPNIEREVNLDFGVDSIDIMESNLKRTGAEYTILESIKL